MGSTHEASRDPEYDAVVIGGGFAGIYAVHRLRDRKGLRVRAFEAGSGFGGVWHWNRYPGARCDIESLEYSYSFSRELQQEWQWKERYAPQPEILDYLNHVADRFDVRKEFEFDSKVTSMAWDEAGHYWTVTTSRGVACTARYVVSCTGCLSAPKKPEIAGLDTFKGDVYLTHSWPDEEVSFAGKHVGVIGTGSSGVQVIPEIAREAASLTVFQRTPNYVIPSWNRPTDPEQHRAVLARYEQLRLEARATFAGVALPPALPSALAVPDELRTQRYEEKYRLGGLNFLLSSFADLLFDERANETAAEFVRGRIASVVKDPEVARTLTPRGYPVGTKRIPLENGYFETFNKPNVQLVDVTRAPIQEVTETGLRTTAAEYPLDVLVLATGFDAFTGALLSMGIVGRDGLTLNEKWADGPRTYLGLATHGFPNLFEITGPQSPNVFYNCPLAAEDHVEWASDAIEWLEANGYDSLEPTAEAEEAWNALVLELQDQTLFPRGANGNSWYVGTGADGRRTALIYLGGAPQYRQTCSDVAAKGYEGFTLTRTAVLSVAR
jgi:cation diffusion facilitator CzcD-associated flavoprotein CzcO